MSCKFTFIAIACILCTAIRAQKTETIPNSTPVKMVYGEIGGPGLFSVNYDQRFKGNKGWGFRAGMGGIGFLTSGIFAFPVGINYLTGSDSHYAEFGGGVSAITISDGDFFDNTSSTVIGFLNLGYRYQPEKRGFTARVFICPLITGAGVFPFYGGISAGFRF